MLVNVPEYYLVYKQQTKRKIIIDTIYSIADQYCYTFLNIEKYTFCATKKYFCNYTHLNNNGADVFTKVILGKL